LRWAATSRHCFDHGSNLEEIGLLHNADLTLEESLLVATRAGAELCGVGHRLGRLEPGYEFDAVLLDADPSDLQTYASRTSVTGVFKRGVAVVRHPRLELFTTLLQRDNGVVRSCVPYLWGGDCAATRQAGSGTREGSGGLCEYRSACVTSGSRALR